jgi:hypothetical protein
MRDFSVWHEGGEPGSIRRGGASVIRDPGCRTDARRSLLFNRSSSSKTQTERHPGFVKILQRPGRFLTIAETLSEKKWKKTCFHPRRFQGYFLGGHNAKRVPIPWQFSANRASRPIASH